MYTLIIDTETCGLPKKFNAPYSDSENWPRLVQLSFIFSDGDRSAEFDYIIRPDGFQIPPEASKIHGITTERALVDGYDLKFVLSLFRTFLNVSDRVVAHNLDFDKGIIGAEYHRIGIGEAFEKRLKEKDQFCTMRKSTEILKLRGTHAGGSKWPKLIELYKALFNEEFDGAHNALMDTRACAKCYFELVKK